MLWDMPEQTGYRPSKLSNRVNGRLNHRAKADNLYRSTDRHKTEGGLVECVCVCGGGGGGGVAGGGGGGGRGLGYGSKLAGTVQWI